MNFLRHAGMSRAALVMTGANLGNYASTPDRAAFSIPGDMGARAFIAPNDWTPASEIFVLAKRSASVAYRLSVGTTGLIRFAWSANGTTTIVKDSTVAVPAADRQRKGIWATLDVDDGAGNNVVTFYVTNDFINWTQLGDPVVTVGTTSVFDSGDALEIGAQAGGTAGLWNAGGKVFRAQVLNGLFGGTVVADFDPRRFQGGNTIRAVTGEVWTINRSGIDTCRIAA